MIALQSYFELRWSIRRKYASPITTVTVGCIPFEIHVMNPSWLVDALHNIDGLTENQIETIKDRLEVERLWYLFEAEQERKDYRGAIGVSCVSLACIAIMFVLAWGAW